MALIGQELKPTKSTDDLMDRWMAATAVFDDLILRNLIAQYGFGNRSTYTIDGLSYRTFTVTYADGIRESWPVLPNDRLSSDKLSQTPIPGSMRP
ncbi:hypothetical protein ACFQZY_17245 [Ramlibacter sp. GCM10027632]